MKAGWRRALEAALGLGVVAAAVVWLSGGCGERIAPGEVGDPRPAAEGPTAPVEHVVAEAVEWTAGGVESARRTAVSSRIMARIEAIPVSAGSEVRAGETLVRLDARELRARVKEAEEGLRAARAQLDLARREAERIESLFEQGVAPQQRLDEVRSRLRVARAEVERRQQTLEEVRAGLSHAEITSPVSGRVVERLAEPGDTAVPGRPILRVYDPSVLRASVPVRESLAVRLSVGDRLQVRVPSLGETMEGTIDEIVPFAEPGARTLLVKVRLPVRPELYAGLFARVAIPAGERRRVLVPQAAVERVGQLAFVTVVPEDGPPARRLITLGPPLAPDRIEVLSGLAEGERVAVPPAAAAGGAGATQTR